MGFSDWFSGDVAEFILRHKVEGLFVLVIIAVLFRKKIKDAFRKKPQVDYSSMMSNGESFDATFDFNKTIASEKNLYEKRLEQIDEEMKSIKLELGRLDEEYSKKKDMLLHHERQLILQYNTFIKNLNNLNLMSKEHETMEKKAE